MEDIEESLKTLNTEINKLTEKRNKLEQEKQKILNQLYLSCNIPLYVGYSVDLDFDCLKKSEIKILGVYLDKETAEIECAQYDNKNFKYSTRYSYTMCEQIILNKKM
jgi:hypothetical protein